MNKHTSFELLLDFIKKIDKPIYLIIIFILTFYLGLFIMLRYPLNFLFIENNYHFNLVTPILIINFILCTFFAYLCVLFIRKELLALNILNYLNGKSNEIKCPIDLIDKHIFIIKDDGNINSKFFKNNKLKLKNKEISNLLQIDDYNFLKRFLILSSPKSKITISSIKNTEIFISNYSVLINAFYDNNPNFCLDMFARKLINIYFIKKFTGLKNKAYLSNGKIICFKLNNSDKKNILIGMKNTILLKHLFNVERNNLLKNSKRLLFKDILSNFKEKFENILKLILNEKTDGCQIDTNELKDIMTSIYVLAGKEIMAIKTIAKKYNQYVFLDYVDYMYSKEEKISKIMFADLDTKKVFFVSGSLEENPFMEEIAYKLIFSKLLY